MYIFLILIEDLKNSVLKSTYEKLQITNSTSLRVAIYKCAIEKIKIRPILGHGWGVGDLLLIDCYKDKSDYLFRKKLNSHNQFLDYYLNGGFLLLFILIYFLYYQIIFSIKQKKTFTYFNCSFLYYSNAIRKHIK